jgi:hypothetical protein
MHKEQKKMSFKINKFIVEIQPSFFADCFDLIVGDEVIVVKKSATIQEIFQILVDIES